MKHYVEPFMDYLKADRGYSRHTLVRYRTALDDMQGFMESLDETLTWETLDADVIRRWEVKKLQEGLSPRTMQCHLSALRSFYKYLMLLGYTDKSPMQKIKNPKAEKRLPTFLKEQEVNRLFNDIDFGDTFAGCRDRMILLTFYSTGIRLSELIGLDVEHVDTAGRYLKVRGKRNKERIVPMGEELTQAFNDYFATRKTFLAGQNCSPVFISLSAKRCNSAEIQNIVRHYLSMVTLQKKKSPHVLRHTFATVMLNNGADIEAVKEILGHESLKATEVYTHTTLSDLKKQYEQAHPRA